MSDDDVGGLFIIRSPGKSPSKIFFHVRRFFTTFLGLSSLNKPIITFMNNNAKEHIYNIITMTVANRIDHSRGFRYRVSALYPIIALIGLYRFTTSFFLAKKSMPHISLCQNTTASDLLQNEIGLESGDIDFLHKYGILSTFSHGDNDRDTLISSNGCWMPRRADAMAIVVVDALRFDFALQHLPKSIGARLSYEDHNTKDTIKGDKPRGQSQLFKFVADPPTVTMQRLKGLTTGGLPTFADISGSFGGANVDEDSWVQQLYDVPISRRGLNTSIGIPIKNERQVQIAFVGDDTWVDLFPHQFDDSHPYPSFNTRDLDTVDNGCLEHLPRLLRSFGSNRITKNDKYFEVIVSHFLGVDHVGHTYGPHNIHMDEKLNQIDDVLQSILSKIDEATNQCHVAFVFGDHGMTEDGNHGGGTLEETNAGLFAHFSPGCGDLGPSLDITGSDIGSFTEEAFLSINQIDLVPTISFLLGLPIPFANLGGVVPMLLPPLHYYSNETNFEAPFIATALALNAAQVWKYLTTYSSTANKLPDHAITELKEALHQASLRFKEAILQENSFDSLAYREACGLFKYFLSQATDLGKQVWTRFDISGMRVGIVLMIFALLLSVPEYLFRSMFFIGAVRTTRPISLQKHYLGVLIEVICIVTVITFHCVVLTFSNSYIISEEFILMFMLSMLCIMTWIRHSLLHSHHERACYPFFELKSLTPILIAFCSRLHQLLVTGHGQDPMIRKHWAHNTHVFIVSLCLLGLMRFHYFSIKSYILPLSKLHVVLDIANLIMLGCSWIEKRSLDVSRHGYLTSRFAIIFSTVGFIIVLSQLCKKGDSNKHQSTSRDTYFHTTILIVIKIMLFIIAVTGPSTATSCILLIIQVRALSQITFAKGNNEVSIHCIS